MKKLKFLAKIVAAAAFLSIVLTGCPGPASEPTPSTPEKNTNTDNPITGPLTVAETWAGEDDEGEPITYYINSTYTIKQGGALTIEEGAIVKLGPNGGFSVDGSSGGSIIANNVIFTSSKDSRGRKILAAGEAAPWQGDWKRIYICNGAHAEFYGCEFAYGGNGVSAVTVADRGTSCRIDGCLFKYCAGDRKVANKVLAALKYVGDVTFANDENTPDNKKNLVTNTTFENNVWPLSIPPYFDISGTNHFGIGDKANEYNMIHLEMSVAGANSIKNNVVWETQEVPYMYCSVNNLNVSNGGTLTIKGGTPEKPTVVEFADKGMYIADGGTLKLEENIIFTNNEKAENTPFDGMYCYASFKAYKDSTHSKTISKVIFESNETANIIIKNYVPSNAYIRDSNYDGYENFRIKTIDFINTKFTE